MSRRSVRLPHVYRPWAKVARRLRWTVELTGGGHLCWTPPQGVPVITPSTPSNRRGLLNARAMLRRKGLPI